MRSSGGQRRRFGVCSTLAAPRTARPGRSARFVPVVAIGARRMVHGVLHGRDAERARLAAVLDDARAGRAATLLVHGEPGAGKSALLDDLDANAGSGVCILRTQGVESEAPL